MDDYLTTKQAAEKLGISDARIRQMIAKGVIKESMKAGRDIFIPSAEIGRLEKTPRPAGRPKGKGK